jgi:hypothetical protein
MPQNPANARIMIPSITTPTTIGHAARFEIGSRSVRGSNVPGSM